MFVRVLISVDGPYAPAPISGVDSVLASQAPWLGGMLLINSHLAVQEHNPRKIASG